MKKSLRAHAFAPALSVLSLAVAASLHAQTIELDPVVVSATRIEQKLSDVIPSASVITREEIERSQAPTLIDLIQGQPGVEIGRNGGPGTVASIFMRGQDSKNVAVFIDGIPVQRDSSGALKLVDIPPSQIEKIEILRGNMGAIYGDSAVGGAIHIITRSGTGQSGPTASASYGSRNTSDLTAGYKLSGHDYKLGFSVQKIQTDGYSAMNPSQNSSVNPDKDAFEREAVFLNGEKKVSKDVLLGFQVNNIDSKVDYDGTDGSTVLHNSKQKSSDLTVYSRINLSSDWRSRISVTQSSFSNREFKNITTPNDSFDGDQLGLRWGNNYLLGSGDGSFGLDLTNSQFKGILFGKSFAYERDSVGYYAGYSRKLDRLDYQVNLRRDEIKDKTSSINESVNTWLLGASYKLTDISKLTGLASTSFRAPATAEFGDTPMLKSEEHIGYEIGFGSETKIGAFKFNYFNTTTNNAISYTGVNAKAAVIVVNQYGRSCVSNCYENIEKVNNNGYELSLGGKAKGWGYKFSMVTQDPRNAKTGERLTRRAKQYGSIDLDRKFLGVDFGTQLRVSKNSPDFDYNTWPYTPKKHSYTVVNLTAAKNITPLWKAKLRLENVFDEKYQLAYGYDAVPLGVFFTLQYQPK
jgi:vitamin B12 transporter